MDSRHNVGTNSWNEVAVPVVRSRRITKVLDRGRVVVRRTGRQAAHGGACGSPGGV